MPHKYSKEQLEFLAAHVGGNSHRRLTDQFNLYFGLNLTLGQIKATCKRYKLFNGRNCRFAAGIAPWNKGLKFPGVKTANQFKPGQLPWNCRTVGSERVNQGYVEVKIADPDKWRTKHRVIWESANGPLPPRHVIIFADGNRRNFDLSNLLMISRRELVVMNRFGLIADDGEITRTQLNIARILIKCVDRKK